jgi:hypothetical protein
MTGRVFAIDDEEPLAAQLAPFAAEEFRGFVDISSGTDLVRSVRRA